MRKNNLNNLFMQDITTDLIVVDAMNVVHRYLHTMKNLHDSQGRETGIFYGVLNFVYGLKLKYKEAEILFLWDSGESNKKKINKEYKNNRKEKPEGFWNQIKELQYLLSFLNVEQWSKEGYEADDLAGYVLEKNKEKNILFVSKDNDWLQLIVDEKKKIQIEDKIFNKEEVENSLGMKVKNYPLFKSIVGDSCDNIHSIFKAKKLENQKTIKEIILLFQNGNLEGNGSDSFEISTWFEEEELPTYSYIFNNREKLIENFKLVAFQKVKGRIEKIKKIKNKKMIIDILKGYEMNGLIKKLESLWKV